MIGKTKGCRPRGGAARRRALAALLCTAALTVSGACSSDDSSNGSGGSGTDGASSSGGGDAFVTSSQALVDQATETAVTGPSSGVITPADIVPWTTSSMTTPSTLPSGPLDVAVVTMSGVGPPPYDASMITAIGDKLGWTVTVIQSATPDPPGTLAAVRQALLGKPDAIITITVPAVWVAQALSEAKQAGVPTVAIYGNENFGEGYDAYVSPAANVEMSLLGAWAVAQSKGKANSLLVSAPGFEDAEVAAAGEYLKGCSGCKTDTLSIPPADFFDQTKMQATATAALATRTDTNYMIWPQGGAPLQGTLNGIRASRAPDTVVITDAAGPQTIQLLQDGTLPVLVHVPDAALDLIAMDQVSRLVQGQEPMSAAQVVLPVAIWTKDNGEVDPTFQAVTAAQIEQNDFVSPYATAWGIDDLKDIILGVED